MVLLEYGSILRCTSSSWATVSFIWKKVTVLREFILNFAMVCNFQLRKGNSVYRGETLCFLTSLIIFTFFSRSAKKDWLNSNLYWWIWRDEVHDKVSKEVLRYFRKHFTPMSPKTNCLYQNYFIHSSFLRYRMESRFSVWLRLCYLVWVWVCFARMFKCLLFWA